MAFKNKPDNNNKNKRKTFSKDGGGGGDGGGNGKFSPKKKFKSSSNDQPNKGFKKPFDGKPKFNNNKPDTRNDGPKTKREIRIQSKELTEARKKKRRPHYTLEQELALLWEKMRRRNIAKEDRSKLVSQALAKMKGKIHEIAGSHVSCRVLQ
nr:pumilio homolog 24 [Tanacetum cinerariifolium]